jgi:hypothetical protein
MTLAVESRATEPRARLVDRAADLACIQGASINLAIWRRADAPRFTRLAAHLQMSDHDETEPHVSRMGGVREATAAARALIPCDEDAAEVLAGELRLLVPLFCRIAEVKAAGVRFDFLAHDGCKKFHCDWVGLRLLSTYHGPGTEYLPEHAVNRAMLGRGTNPDICRDPSAVRRMARGHVGLFKGEAYPGNQGSGIVHRSAPIAGSGKTRLLLVINAA